MTSTNDPIENARALTKNIIACGLPDIEKTTPVLHRPSNLTPSFAKKFDSTVSEIVGRACHSKSPAYIENYKDSAGLLLSSLIAAAFQWQHLSVPRGDEKETHNKKIGLSRRHIEKIMPVLEDGWCTETRCGFKHHKDSEKSRGTQYYPTERTIQLFAEYLYQPAGDFDNYTPYKYNDNAQPWDSNEEKNVKVLQRYNEMMREHSWAMKAPTTRTCGAHPFTVGRVITPYQNIVNRRIPIRKKTLLDGRPLMEVDFQANHPYLLASLTGNQYEGDFYAPIVRETGIDRSKVKRIVSACIGAKKVTEQTRLTYALLSEGISNDDVTAVVDTCSSLYPWIHNNNLFFSNKGVNLQWIEGEVAMRMFEWAVNNRLPLLCIHDAFACHLEHQQLVSEVMHRFRDEVLQQHLHRYIKH